MPDAGAQGREGGVGRQRGGAQPAAAPGEGEVRQGARAQPSKRRADESTPAAESWIPSAVPLPGVLHSLDTLRTNTAGMATHAHTLDTHTHTETPVCRVFCIPLTLGVICSEARVTLGGGGPRSSVPPESHKHNMFMI